MSEYRQYHDGIYSWLQKERDLQEANRQLQPFLRSELSLSFNQSSLRNVLAVCRDSQQHDQDTLYELSIDSKATSIDRAYISLLTTSSLLLGHIYDPNVEELVFPYPSPYSLQELSPYNLRDYKQAYILCNELIEKRSPTEWDADLVAILDQKGNRWKQIAMDKGEKLITFLDTPLFEAVLPLVEERMDEDIWQ